MKNALRMYASILLVVTLIIGTCVMSFAEVDEKAMQQESNFDFTVEDLNGRGISDVELYLYSFLDNTVVASSVTDSIGNAKITYKPNVIEFNDEMYVYGDYLVYAVKNGNELQEYNLTKVYTNPQNCTKEMINSADNINAEKYVIQTNDKFTKSRDFLDKDSVDQKVLNKVKTHLIKEKRLSKGNPICVVTNEDFTKMECQGVITQKERTLLEHKVEKSSTLANADYSLRNKLIPIGTFHVSKGATLDVTFQSSDSVKIECGIKGTASSNYGISGSRTRALATSTKFPTYSTQKSPGGNKRYSTYGDFEEWTTVTYYGSTSNHIGVKVINGGTALGSEGTCSSCGKSYDSLLTNHGTCITALNGGSVSQTTFREKSVNVGSKVSFSGIGLELGVTRITGSNTTILYKPKTGYNLRIYNNDTATWHCSTKAV